ncbi:hypothetical protein FQN54_008714 [Arachnomyces sp. PD_36]|nr:hypothetical protein FQN54_008714 [Arachnomyces sp. PD_36]
MRKSALLSVLSTGFSTAATAAVLKNGPSLPVEFLQQPLSEMQTNLSRYTLPANYGEFSNNEVHPIQPGGSVVVGHEECIVSAFAFGNASLYADANGKLLPEDEWIPASMDTIYDMASLTKVFTAVAALRAMDDGKLALEEPVASYMPEFAENGKDNVTVRMLLTHTSGFRPDPQPGLYSSKYPTLQQRVDAIIRYPLANAPGTKYVYSDLNFMNLRYLLETVTGQPIEDLFQSFTSALDMTNTFFNSGNKPPAQIPSYNRMAPTEYQIAVLGPQEPQRPQPVRGTVHDENAWSLDGVSGHAGLFSTAPDLAKFCQMILNNGTYGGKRILSEQSVDMMFTNFNEDFPGDAHSIGFELDQYYFSGPMASSQTGGHTGFTGTSLVLDHPSRTYFVMLAHRVQPSREWSDNNIVRQALGYWVAKALGRDVSFPST